MLVNLADWCFRRRRLVVVAWLGALVGVLRSSPARSAGSSGRTTCSPGPSRRAASETLEESFPQRSGDTVQIVLHADARGHRRPRCGPGPRSSSPTSLATTHVVGVASPFAAGGAAQISDDGTTAYADVALDKTDNEYTPAQATALVDPILAAGDDTLQVEVGGPVAALSQTAPVGSEVHRARRRRRSSCSSPSAPPWRWDCRC